MESDPEKEFPPPSMIHKGGEWIYPPETSSGTEGSTQKFSVR